MAYVITDACIMDFVCAAECATAAIAPASADDAAAGISQLFINPDECIDCGNCASICPSARSLRKKNFRRRRRILPARTRPISTRAYP